MKNALFSLLFVAAFAAGGQAQNATDVTETFKDTWVINSYSVETLPQRKLDIRIGHRFGDMFGDRGGWATLYGLENAADILIGAEYGVTDNFTLGLSRSKGAADRRQLVNGLVKYRVIQQQIDGAPVSLGAAVVTSMSTMPQQENTQGVASFPKFIHRFAFSGQVLLARKFSDGFSLQIMPGYTHRNLVVDGDVNGLFTVGMATRIQLTKVFGLILEGYLPLNGAQSPFSDAEPALGVDYQIPLGIGLEIDTGGHVFQVNFTNAQGIIATDFLPNTQSNWGDGEFRLGFTISRLFNL
jgi:hypothetical protein